MTECLKEPAFVVGDIDDTINLSLLPVSGEEYIKRVVLEAQKCADVVVADIDKTRLKKPTIEIQPDASKHPPWLGPTLDWQHCQLLDFSEVRLYVSQLKDQMQTGKRKWKPLQIDLPDVDDEHGWTKFCSSCCDKESRIIPTLGIVFCLNQSTIEQVLEYLVEDARSKGKIEYELGQWIFALLAVLEMPLTPDVCSCLRSLARTCSIIRKTLETQELGALNLFICLVARYFRQLDLADP